MSLYPLLTLRPRFVRFFIQLDPFPAFRPRFCTIFHTNGSNSAISTNLLYDFSYNSIRTDRRCQVFVPFIEHHAGFKVSDHLDRLPWLSPMILPASSRFTLQLSQGRPPGRSSPASGRPHASKRVAPILLLRTSIRAPLHHACAPAGTSPLPRGRCAIADG